MTRLLLALFAVSLAPALASAEEPVGVKRVLVMDIKPIDADAADVASLPAEIEKDVTRHPGFTAVGREPLVDALATAGAKSAAACAEDSACITKVAASLSASLIVTGSLEKKRKGYVLSLSLIDPRNPTAAAKQSESMKRLSSLAMNVPVVLDHLFKWDDPPIPPPEFDLPADDTPPPASAVPPVIPRTRRVAVLSVTGQKVPADDVKAVPALIVKELGNRKGYEPVALDDIQKALQKAGAKSGEECSKDKSCTVHVAEAVHADLVLTAVVSKSKRTYDLQMNLSTPAAPQQERSSESMKRLSSLPMNVPLCLDKLLK